MSKRFFVSTAPTRGLPPRIYLPIAAVFIVLFLGTMAYFLFVGFGTGGSLFGSSTGATGSVPPAPPAVSVEGGGPPPEVQLQLKTLRARIAKNPRDDVALTQLGDMFLAVGKNAQAIPLYRRALAANPQNVAAKEGLSEAQSAEQTSQ